MEAALAKFHNKDGALVFSSGYVAGSETLDALGKHIPNVVFLSDSENHASMIAGMRNSRARRLIWKHNDMEDLERQLQTLPLSQPKVIAFESVYSMSGNVAPIRDIIQLAKKYGALTFLDEVHGVGLYGPNGGGVSEHLDWEIHYNGNPLGQRTLQDEIDIISGTMGKAFGTYGGFIATSAEVADMVRSFASGFIFTLALPPALMAGGVASVEYVAKSSQERVRLAKNALLVKKLLYDYDIPVTPNPSHILPIFVGEAEKTRKAAEVLLDEHSIYVTPVNAPSVRPGQEILRISPGAIHTKEDCYALAKGLDVVWTKLGIKRGRQWDPTGLRFENNHKPLWTPGQLDQAVSKSS